MTAESRNPYPVSDTAALVMLWASGYYRTQPMVSGYLNRLDLSAGRQLLARYNRVCPWYSEVIINRKHFIRNTVETLIGMDAKSTTVVNLGAGFSPLALELSPLLSDSVRFIEIDMNGMSRKHQMYSELVPEQSRFISCIEGDITDTTFLRDTLDAEIGSGKPTHLVIVMEGLTYYISKQAMGHVLDTLSGIAPAQTVVFEHLKPCRQICEERRFIPYRIFSHVMEYTSLDRMTTYTKEEVRAIFASDFSCSYYDMAEMELRRTGSGTYFPTPDSGWLSCAVAMHRSGTRDDD